MFFFSKIKMYLAAVGIALAAIIAAYFNGRREGMHEYEREADKDLIEKMRKSNEVEDEIESLDDPYLVDRARKWVRKNNK